MDVPYFVILSRSRRRRISSLREIKRSFACGSGWQSGRWRLIETI